MVSMHSHSPTRWRHNRMCHQILLMVNTTRLFTQACGSHLVPVALQHPGDIDPLPLAKVRVLQLLGGCQSRQWCSQGGLQDSGSSAASQSITCVRSPLPSSWSAASWITSEAFMMAATTPRVQPTHMSMTYAISRMTPPVLALQKQPKTSPLSQQFTTLTSACDGLNEQK